MPAWPPIPSVNFSSPYQTTEEAKEQLDQARSEVSGLKSAAVSSRILNEPRGGAFLYAVSEAIEKNKGLRNKEIAKALIHRVVTATNDDAIVDPNGFAFLGIYIHVEDGPEPRSWEAPLLGILNLIEPEALKEDEKFNPNIVKPILAALPDMMKAIWQDLSYLLHEGTIGDYRRCLVARTIYMISQVPGQRDNMYDVPIISLIMHCWIYMSPNPIYRLSASACARYVFYQSEVPPPPRGALQFALKAISVETFISREKAVLESPELLGFPLEMEFKALAPFTGSTLSCSQIFSDTKFYICIVDALYKQLTEVESTLKYDVPELCVFSEGHRLIWNFLNRVTKAQPASYILHDIIRHSRVIRVGAAGFYMASKEECLKGDWYKFFWILSRVANPGNPPPQGFPFYPVENILNDTRNALRHVFYSTTSQLASSGNSSKQYCDLWEQLGKDYMIQPESTLKFCIAQRRCCNIFCPRSAAETAKLRCCKRCKETYYCGKECQKTHWAENHKSQCGQASLHADPDDEMPRREFVFPTNETP